MLAEQIFDLRDAGVCPILDPGFAEIVLDVMKAAMVHSGHDRPGRGPGQWAGWLIWSARSAY
jgi:hypothetical protein